MNKLLITLLISSLLALTGACAPVSTPDEPPATSAPTPTLTSPPEVLEPPPSQPAIQPPELIKPVSHSTELITRHYSWQYRGTWTWDLEIPQDLYEYYKELPRPPTQNYSIYVTHPYDDRLIGDLVSKLNNVSQNRGFNDVERVEIAIDFVQSLPYTADSVTTPFDEYPRYPIETLVDNGGDCEDTSILLASLLHAMGYGTVLIMFPDHVGVGVKGDEERPGTYYEYKGDRYFYIETTGEGWSIGELPQQMENTKAHIYPMLPTPILVHKWSTTSTGRTVDLEVTVQNMGSATADDVFILAGFDAGEDMLWNLEKSEPFRIQVDQQVTARLSIRVPPGKHTRLVIQIEENGHTVGESRSKWVDT